MIEAIAVTIAPIGFLIVLFGGGAAFKRRAIEQDGEAPINRTLFYVSKYSILVVWGAMVLPDWGIGMSVVEAPAVITGVALALWVFGFVFLFLGRFELALRSASGLPGRAPASGSAVCSGSAGTRCIWECMPRSARPSSTLDPLILVLGAGVVAIHHRIVLAEEDHMRTVFRRIVDYSHRVRRYCRRSRARARPPLFPCGHWQRWEQCRPDRVRRDRPLPDLPWSRRPRFSSFCPADCGIGAAGAAATVPARPEPFTLRSRAHRAVSGNGCRGRSSHRTTAAIVPFQQVICRIAAKGRSSASSDREDVPGRHDNGRIGPTGSPSHRE